MDKTRDVRRGGTNRFSEQKLLAGLKNPEKERVNKSASSTVEDLEMGFDGNIHLSDRENGTPSKSHSSTSNATIAKKFKLPKKILDVCNGVDHSPVPRKLRSAMKKRNHESISPPLPDSKKLNHTIDGVKSLEKNCLKKSKLNMKQRSLDLSQKQTVGPITKDEEEVMETLYAMAGMFPDNDNANKNKSDSAPSEAKPTDLAEHRRSPTQTINDSAVAKEESGLAYPFRTFEAAPSSNVEMSHDEAAKVIPWDKPSAIEEKPDLHNSKILYVKTDSCVPLMNMHSTMPLSANVEHDDRLSGSPVNFQAQPEQCLDSGLELTTQKETAVPRKHELAFGATITNQEDMMPQDIITETGKNGLALWPGLSPMVFHGAGSPAPASQSLAAKIPAWLDAAIGANMSCSLENGSPTEKVHEWATKRRSLKRCAAHVYISCLIRDIQMPEKDKSPLLFNRLKPPHKGQRLGTTVINDIDRVKKGLNGVISSNSIGSTTIERNLNEDKSGNRQQKKLHEDQLQTVTASGLHAVQKQSFNFLSLSAGSGVAEATNGFNRTRNNTLESLSQFQVSYLNSLPQHQQFMPITLPQTRYSSYPDKLSTSGTASSQQVQLQLPLYHSSPFFGPGSTVSTKHRHQQQLWAAQLAAECKPTGHSTAMSQFPNWPNGTQDTTLIPYPQSIAPPSLSSLEINGPHKCS